MSSHVHIRLHSPVLLEVARKCDNNHEPTAYVQFSTVIYHCLPSFSYSLVMHTYVWFCPQWSSVVHRGGFCDKKDSWLCRKPTVGRLLAKFCLFMLKVAVWMSTPSFQERVQIWIRLDPIPLTSEGHDSIIYGKIVRQ